MIVRAVIFDMDGLMLHTEPLYQAAWQQASADCGFVLSDAIYDRLTGLRRVDAERILMQEFGARFSIGAFRGACQKAETEVFTRQPPSKKIGIDEILDFLESRGIPKAVATSTERPAATAQLQAAALLGRFQAVATGDEVVNGKPSPELFLLAAERLRMDPASCLVLEDSEAGVVAAKRADMRVYLVPDGGPPSVEARSLASGVFDSLSLVMRHLEREGLLSSMS